MTQGVTEKKPKYTASQEAFCLFLFKGMSQTDAYKAAYPKAELWTDNAVYVAASRLANSANVLLRLQELRDTCAAPAIASVEERKERLTKYQRANLLDFVGEDGEIQVSKNIPGHEAIREYSVTTRYTKDGRPIINKHIKLADPIASITEHNRMERIGTPDNQQSGNLSISITVNYPEGYQPKVIEGEVKQLS